MSYRKQRAAIMACFQRYDLDKNGKIDYGELKSVLQGLDAKSWPDGLVKILFEYVDQDSSAVIEYREFVDWIFGRINAATDETGVVQDALRSGPGRMPASIERQADKIYASEQTSIAKAAVGTPAIEDVVVDKSIVGNTATNDVVTEILNIKSCTTTLVEAAYDDAMAKKEKLDQTAQANPPAEDKLDQAPRPTEGTKSSERQTVTEVPPKREQPKARRPTVGDRVFVKSSKKIGVIIEDSHLTMPYTVEYGDGTVSRYRYERDVELDWEEALRLHTIAEEEKETEEKKENVKQLFTLFDRDGDRVLSLKELGLVLRTLNPSLWTNEAIDVLFDNCDANKDGQIQINEFMDWCFKEGPQEKDVLKWAKTRIIASEMTPQLKDILDTCIRWSGYNDYWIRLCQLTFNEGKQIQFVFNPHGTSERQPVLWFQTIGCSIYNAWGPEDGIAPIERDIKEGEFASSSALGGWAWEDYVLDICFLAPEHTRLPGVGATERHALADGVIGYSLGSWKAGAAEVLRFSFSVRGLPFDNVGSAIGRHCPSNPCNHSNMYSHHRTWFPVLTARGVGVVWQSYQDWVPQLSIFTDEYKSHRQVSLPSTGGCLAAAAADGKHLYLLLIEKGDGRPVSSRSTVVIKADADGREICRAEWAGNRAGLGPDQSDFNITSFYESGDGSNRNVASMVVLGSHLGIILARTMHLSSDGLNHQGAIALVLSTETLELVKHHGQTSGHSFDSVVTAAEEEFIGADLADNFPRGIHLHRFDSKRIISKVVYTFKTLHGREPFSPAGFVYDKYESISKDGQIFYKWSNDNRTYTELGGVAKVGSFIVVAFAGEGSPSSSCLDCSIMDPNMPYRGMPRNLGLVVVRDDFANAHFLDDVVSSKANSTYEQNGGFFTFQGTWQKQRTVGVRWLTDYVGKDNVSRVRILKCSQERLLILWEKWTDVYVSTYAVEVDGEGSPIASPVEFGSHVRLGRRDEGLVTPEGDVILFHGDGKRLEMTVIARG